MHIAHGGERMERSSSDFLKVPPTQIDMSPSRSDSQVPSSAKESDKNSPLDDDDTEMIELGEINEDDEEGASNAVMDSDIPMGDRHRLVEEKQATTTEKTDDEDEVDLLEPGDTMDTN